MATINQEVKGDAAKGSVATEDSGRKPTRSVSADRGTHTHNEQVCMFDAAGKTIVWLCGYNPRTTIKHSTEQQAVLAAGGVPEFGFVEDLNQ